MKNRTPSQTAGLVFLCVVFIGIVSIALRTLFGPAVNEGTGDLIELISSATCPAAVVASAAAYFWAKGRA